ncbi:23S rRNA (uracil(1939)-C(5))-methyltransferase RlmD [Alteromonas sp.]|nr:23S rRNA (uracil(1939)-C(5))-methyltransferase RlmD [Alteromonas sp.]
MVNFYKPGKTKSVISKRENGKVKARASASAIPKQASLTIDSLDWMGNGVVRGEIMYFVEGALPGEACDVNVVSSKKRVANATTTKLNSTSEYRATPFCSLASACGGCQLQHIEANAALSLRDDALKTMLMRQLHVSGDVWVAPLSGSTPAYRRKARLAIDARNMDNVKLGFREHAGKNVINAPLCPVLVPALNALLTPLQSLFSEYECARAIGHVTLIAGDNVAQVSVKHTRPLSPEFVSALGEFGSKHSINVCLENKQGRLSYVHRIAELKVHTQGGLTLSPAPNDFIQVNESVNQQMITQALAWLAPKKGERVADWFSGLGNFSLPIARTGAEVQAVEGVPEMVQRAEQNAHEQGIKNVQWLHLDLANEKDVRGALSKGFDKVLIDPSREGALTVCHALAEAKPQSIVYVSCNPSTFIRDARVLLEQHYVIEKAGAVEMFPFTQHMEMMALFTRKKQ